MGLCAHTPDAYTVGDSIGCGDPIVTPAIFRYTSIWVVSEMIVPKMVSNAVIPACRLMCEDKNGAAVTQQISTGIVGFAESFYHGACFAISF